MALDWEKIIIIDDDEVIEGEDETVMIFASGVPGSSATVEVVGTETLEPTEDAYVENLGTNQNAKLKFGIPHGASGVWGGIAGEIDNQADLKAKFDNVYTKAEADALLDEKLDDLQDQTKTGGIVEFDAKTDHAIKDLTVSIDPVQDLHGYDNPWPAGGGKNIAKLSADIAGSNQRSTPTYSDSGVTVTATGTYGRYGWIIPVTSGQTYTVSYYAVASNAKDSDYNDQIFYGNSDGTWSNSASGYLAQQTVTTTKTKYTYTFTASTSVFFFGIYVSISATSGSITVTELQLESGSTATSYAPYANICPISGHSSAVVTRTGKNLLQNIRDASVEINGITFTKNSDGSVTISGTASATAYYNINYLTTVATAVMDFVPLRGKQLALSVSETAVSNVQMSCEYFREDGSFAAITNATVITSGNFTVPSDAYRARTYLRVSSGAVITTPVTVYPMLLVASDTDRTYEPYQGTSVTIDLDGTRYGGTLDVLTGEMTVDRAIVTHTLTELAGMSSVETLTVCKRYYTSNYAVGIKSGARAETLCNVCAMQYNSTDTPHYYTNNDGSFLFYAPIDMDGSTSIQLLYPLATPVTVTLTPAEVASLIGHNVLWCDTGNSTVVLRLTTGDLAYQDDIDYTSSQLKNKPTLGTMASKDDATSDTKAYGRKDGAWYDLDGRYYTESEVDDILADKADIIHTSASGSLVHITDGAAYPVDALSVDIEPVQDLHGYDAPWPAGGGKNLLPVGDKAGSKNHEVTFTPNGDGTYNVSGTAAQTVNWNIWDTAQDIPSFLNGAKLSGGANSDVSVSITFYENDTWKSAQFSNPSEITINVPEGANKYQVGIRFDHQGVSYTGVIKPMIRLASSANADWEPYANICPISGWSNAVVTRTGINIWDEETEEGIINVDTGLNHITNDRIRSKNYISVKPNTSYYFYAGSDYGRLRLHYYDSNKNYLGYNAYSFNNAYTIPYNCYYIRFAQVEADGYPYRNDISINYPSSDHVYHAYNGTSVTVNLNGTRYGGTLDVVNGTLTLTHGFVTFNGSEALYDGWGNGHNQIRTVISGIKQISANNVVANIISNYYPAESANATYTGIVGISLQANLENIYIFDSNFDYENSVNDYKTWLSTHNLQVCFELATPTVITGLTPAQISLLLGENNVFADTGNTEVTYIADSKMYIDKKFAELQALILEN